MSCKALHSCAGSLPSSLACGSNYELFENRFGTQCLQIPFAEKQIVLIQRIYRHIWYSTDNLYENALYTVYYSFPLLLKVTFSALLEFTVTY